MYIFKTLFFLNKVFLELKDNVINDLVENGIYQSKEYVELVCAGRGADKVHVTSAQLVPDKEAPWKDYNSDD